MCVDTSVCTGTIHATTCDFAVGFCINVRSISWHTGTQDIWCHLVTANCQVYLDVTNIFIMFSLHIKDLDGRGGRHMGKQGGWHHLKCSCVTRHERLWSSVQNSKLVDTDLQMLSYLIQDDCVLCCIIGIEECWKNVEKLEIHPPKISFASKSSTYRNVPSYLCTSKHKLYKRNVL